MKDRIGTLTREEFDNASRDELWYVVSCLAADRDRCLKDIGRLQGEIAELKEIRRLRTALRYVPSSEQMMFIFPELELYGKAVAPEEKGKAIHVDGYDKREPERRDAASLPPDTPVIVNDHASGAPETKVIDGVEYVRGEDRIVDQIAFMPARCIIERNIWPTYISAEDEGKRRVAYGSKAVDALSCSPSFASHIIVSKLDDHIPYYRQEEILFRSGMRISRQSMAAWVIKYYDALQPMEKLMRHRIYMSPLIHKDETPVRVLDFRSRDGRASTNIFMHVTVGSSWDRKERRFHRLVLFECKEGRRIEALLEEIRAEGFGGYLLTDGLAGYEHYDEGKHCGCWVHAERRFKEILKSDRGNAAAVYACSEASRIFRIENAWRKRLGDGDADEDGFIAGRKEETLPVIEGIYANLKRMQAGYSQTSPTGKAIEYVLCRKEQLTRYLDVVEGVPDNNLCERAIRPFRVGAHNWLFCKSINGADATAFFYSLIESAKLCGLNPADYMEAVCTFGPRCRSDEEFERLLPWNIDLSAVDAMHERRAKARPIGGNKKPFKLSGGHG